MVYEPEVMRSVSRKTNSPQTRVARARELYVVASLSENAIARDRFQGDQQAVAKRPQAVHQVSRLYRGALTLSLPVGCGGSKAMEIIDSEALLRAAAYSRQVGKVSMVFTGEVAEALAKSESVPQLPEPFARPDFDNVAGSHQIIQELELVDVYLINQLSREARAIQENLDVAR